MKEFLGEDFLLSNKVAVELYFDYAAPMPIIDYHNHLPPNQLAENYQFKNLTEAWLHGDHYKWRALRANGVGEKFITGDASDQEKFNKWAETVPYTARNPLYHWTHLELQRYFNISDLLTAQSADKIYEIASEKLQSKEFGSQGLIKKMNVLVLCTTDDPVDELAYHSQIRDSNIGFRVFPAFRPDKVLGLTSPEYRDYLNQLSLRSGIEIKSLDDLLLALQNRVDYFHNLGCRIADLGLARLPMITDESGNNDANFAKALSGKTIDGDGIEQLKVFILTQLCKMYHAKGWVQQFHLGALRNNNQRALRELGPDTGYDSMGDFSHAVTLSKFLDNLDNTNQLAKTILYNLNPADNDLFATMAGNFSDGETIGKIQYGAGWWFLDQKNGIENHLNSLSNMGLFSRFVGMLTDSRSFLSFPRHEYFRRILCNLIGTDVMNGELPYDINMLGQMVEDICYNNANSYFGFKEN